MKYKEANANMIYSKTMHDIYVIFTTFNQKQITAVEYDILCTIFLLI